MVVTLLEDCLYKDLTVQQLPREQQSGQILKNIRDLPDSYLLMPFYSTLQMLSFNSSESPPSHALCNQTPLNLHIVIAFLRVLGKLEIFASVQRS